MEQSYANEPGGSRRSQIGAEIDQMDHVLAELLEMPRIMRDRFQSVLTETPKTEAKHPEGVDPALVPLAEKVRGWRKMCNSVINQLREICADCEI